MRSRCIPAIALAFGCGRIGIDSRVDAKQVDTSQADSSSITDAGVCHSGVFAMPTLIPVATTSHESDPALSADELTMYYTSNRSPSVGYAIWVATRPSRTAPFGAGSIVTELESAMHERDANISSDGLTMYFTSDRSGLEDIYVATRSDPTAPFVVQGPLVINGDPSTARNGSFISADGLGLYYAKGQLEIAFASRPTTSATFTFVRELDELNVPQTDGSPTVTADGLELFFDSYRNGPQSATLHATRASTADPFSSPTELVELTAVAGSNGVGSPEISADGRTLYHFINTGQVDIYATTRDCP